MHNPLQPSAQSAPVAEPGDEDLCIISLCATEGVGPASIAMLRRAAQDRGMSVRAAMALPVAELEADVGLSPPAARAVAGITAPLAAARALLARLRRVGIRAVTAGGPDYPERLMACLGLQAPPALFLAGEPALLGRPSLAIVGSRRPSRTAAEAAWLLARQQAAAGTAIVSGGAHGIDAAGHAGAASSGGTVVVPALGLTRFHWPLPGGSGMPEGRWCAVGQFPPQSGWRAAQALMRNRTIVALSDAVVAFEPRDSGGTWHSSVTALRMRKPLFLVAAARDGAKGRGLLCLVRQGAVALDPRRMPDAPALARLIAEYRPPACADQLALFDEVES